MKTPTTERRKPGPKPKPPEKLLVWRSVRLQPETLAALERLAQERETTVTMLIRDALTTYLETATDGR